MTFSTRTGASWKEAANGRAPSDSGPQGRGLDDAGRTDGGRAERGRNATALAAEAETELSDAHDVDCGVATTASRTILAAGSVCRTNAY